MISGLLVLLMNKACLVMKIPYIKKMMLTGMLHAVTK